MKSPSSFLIIFLFLLAGFQSALAQSDILWQQCHGGSGDDYLWTTRATTDGGFIAVGSTLSSDGEIGNPLGGQDAWVIKVDEAGAIEWEKTFGGTNDEYFRDVLVVPDGYIAVGHSASSDGDLTQNAGDSDFWIAKILTNGSIAWSKTYGGSDEDRLFAVEPKGTGFVAFGDTRSNDGDVSNNAGLRDFWVMNVNSDGNLEWQRSFGGTDNEWAADLQAVSGGFILAGQTFSSDIDVTNNHGGGDMWLVKIDDNGYKVWESAVGGSDDEWLNAVQVSAAGEIFVAGGTHSDDGDFGGNKGGADVMVLGMTAAGGLSWTYDLGGTDSEWAVGMTHTNDGGLIVGAATFSNDGDVGAGKGGQDVWVIKLNSSHSVEWKKVYGGSADEWSRNILELGSNEYLLTGCVGSTGGDISGNHGATDWWLAKLGTSTGFETAAFSDHTFVVYPNPFATSATLQFDEVNNEAYWITIHSLLGEEVQKRGPFFNSQTTLNRKDLADGTYLISVWQDGLQVGRQLLVIQ